MVNEWSGRPVASLQHMLRLISMGNQAIPTVTVDGIYGPPTAGAVKAFQKYVGLPSDGAADQATWAQLVACYRREKHRQHPAAPICTEMEAALSLGAGDSHHTVSLCQCMLQKLSEEQCIRVAPKATGTVDAQTADALKQFQTLCRLPATGELDKITWHHLVLHFGRSIHYNCI